LLLDDYVLDVDNTDEELAWTYSGNSNVVVTLNAATRTVVFSVSGGWTGSETITFRASDPDSEYCEGNVEVIVAAPNQAPWIEPAIADVEIEDGMPYVLDLSAHAHDLDDDAAALRWSVSGANTALFHAWVDVSGKILTVTPVEDADGEDAITLTLRDAAGATASQEVSVTVTPPPSGDPADVDDSGEVDALDVQLVINTALGSGASFDCDINCDGETDALDVQLAINAALGMT
jgi:hypothetical protein